VSALILQSLSRGFHGIFAPIVRNVAFAAASLVSAEKALRVKSLRKFFRQKAGWWKRI
jgi:hypothetical protein